MAIASLIAWQLMSNISFPEIGARKDYDNFEPGTQHVQRAKFVLVILKSSSLMNRCRFSYAVALNATLEVT